MLKEIKENTIFASFILAGLGVIILIIGISTYVSGLSRKNVECPLEQKVNSVDPLLKDSEVDRLYKGCITKAKYSMKVGTVLNKFGGIFAGVFGVILIAILSYDKMM